MQERPREPWFTASVSPLGQKIAHLVLGPASLWNTAPALTLMVAGWCLWSSLDLKSSQPASLSSWAPGARRKRNAYMFALWTGHTLFCRELCGYLSGVWREAVMLPFGSWCVNYELLTPVVCLGECPRGSPSCPVTLVPSLIRTLFKVIIKCYTTHCTCIWNTIPLGEKRHWDFLEHTCRQGRPELTSVFTLWWASCLTVEPAENRDSSVFLEECTLRYCEVG